MKISHRDELLKEADMVLERININIIRESNHEKIDNVAYYNSDDLSRLIFGSILISIPFGPLGIIPLITLLAIHWDYVRGYFDEKEIIKMINDKTLNGDPKLIKMLELLVNDLKESPDVKNVSKLLKSLKDEYDKNQTELQDFYRNISSKWYQLKNPDNIVPSEKIDQLNSIKKKISDSYTKYKDEISKQTFSIARKILSSDKYSAFKTSSGKLWKKSPSRYSYLRRLIKQIEEFFLKEVDPFSVKDLKIKMVPKTQRRSFFVSDIGG